MQEIFRYPIQPGYALFESFQKNTLLKKGEWRLDSKEKISWLCLLQNKIATRLRLFTCDKGQKCFFTSN